MKTLVTLCHFPYWTQKETAGLRKNKALVPSSPVMPWLRHLTLVRAAIGSILWLLMPSKKAIADSVGLQGNICRVLKSRRVESEKQCLENPKVIRKHINKDTRGSGDPLISTATQGHRPTSSYLSIKHTPKAYSDHPYMFSFQQQQKKNCYMC